MNQNNIKECWVFIDDSGNIELSSNNEYFIYGALIFTSQEAVDNFREKYENALIKLFKNNKEVKAASSISNWKRKEIYNVIKNNNCQLISVIEQKSLSDRLIEIEKIYDKELKSKKNKSLQNKLKIKQIRKNNYGYHKSYLIGQLICLIIESIQPTKKTKINITLDQEDLGIAGKNGSFINYLKHNLKYLKNRSYKYTFVMADSKSEYCLQGADFFAHSVYSLKNKNDNQKFNYLNAQNNIIIKNYPYISEKIQ